MPRYRIADLLMDVGRLTVQRGTQPIPLPKLSFDLLRALVEAAPNVLSNEELVRLVWRGVVVGPETVTQRVKLLRDALGDDPAAPRYIAGLRGQGYRLLPAVTAESATPEATTSATQNLAIPAPQRTRLVPLAAGAAVLTLALAYVFIEQFLVARHGEASQPRAPSGADVAPHLPPRSIAVLPFANLGGDK